MKKLASRLLGFTLVELLVVIAIIAILAALLLPTLSKARDRADMAVDLSNVHQILLAVHLYASDSNDYMPSSGWEMGVPGWCYSSTPPGGSFPLGGGPAGLVNQIKNFKGIKPGGTLYPRSETCQLYPYIKNVKILMCPNDVKNDRFWTRQIYLTSYIWNGAVQGYMWSCAGGPMNSTYKLGRFKASNILMWEADEVQAAAWGEWNDFANWPGQGCSGRHGKGATIGRFGGGAERINRSDFYIMANGNPSTTPTADLGWQGVLAAGRPLPNDLWCNPGKPKGYSNCN